MPPSPECEQLREDLLLAKGARNASLTDNARRENEAEPSMNVLSAADLAALDGLNGAVVEDDFDYSTLLDDNASRENEGEEPPMFSPEDLRTFRLRVHEAAARARAAGCDISDLVGDNVGVGPFEG